MLVKLLLINPLGKQRGNPMVPRLHDFISLLQIAIQNNTKDRA